MGNDQADLTSGKNREQHGNAFVLEWDIRAALETVLRIHDALTTRKGRSIPMHPEEVANMLRLEDFLTKAKKYALRRCLCNRVYCRSPEKDKPCILDPEEVMADPSLVPNCKFRGAPL
jgi:hypothetical protein